MAESQHYRELILLLNAHEVEYLVVGGYAVMKYSEPRFTKDLDLWVSSSELNAAKLYHALAEFGAPLDQDGITAETFHHDDIVYQIGVAPVRIDILTRATGVEFVHAWENRVKGNIFGLPVNFISVDDLMANKEATGRSSDLEQLKQIKDAQHKL